MTNAMPSTYKCILFLAIFFTVQPSYADCFYDEELKKIRCLQKKTPTIGTNSGLMKDNVSTKVSSLDEFLSKVSKDEEWFKKNASITKSDNNFDLDIKNLNKSTLDDMSVEEVDIGKMLEEVLKDQKLHGTQKMQDMSIIKTVNGSGNIDIHFKNIDLDALKKLNIKSDMEVQ